MTIETFRILRISEVIKLVGLQKSSIYRGMAAGTFPHSLCLGTRARGWDSASIAQWIESKKCEANNKSEVK